MCPFYCIYPVCPHSEPGNCSHCLCLTPDNVYVYTHKHKYLFFLYVTDTHFSISSFYLLKGWTWAGPPRRDLYVTKKHETKRKIFWRTQVCSEKTGAIKGRCPWALWGQLLIGSQASQRRAQVLGGGVRGRGGNHHREVLKPHWLKSLAGPTLRKREEVSIET